MSSTAIPSDAHLPPNACPVKGKSDIGKKVLITSVGGALRKHPGKVVYGPYTFVFAAQSSVDPNGKKYKEGKLHITRFTSSPYWCVRLEGYGLCISFVEQEMKFV